MVLKGVSEDKFETRLSDLMRPILSITDLETKLGRIAVRRLPNKYYYLLAELIQCILNPTDLG